MERSSEFANIKLLAAEFEGTIAKIFEGDRVDVSEAYRLVVEEFFGVRALDTYIRRGEHKYRVPAEIVHEFMHGSNEQELTAKTEQFAQSLCTILEDEVGYKAGVLWPRPTEGFFGAWESVSAHLRMDTAIISSERASFILKVLDIWGMPRPDILVSDEVIRATSSGARNDDKAKPPRLPMELVLTKWTKLRELPESDTEETIETVKTAGRIVYVGHDVNQDSGLAPAGCDVSFINLEPDKSESAWQMAYMHLRLGKAGIEHLRTLM